MRIALVTGELDGELAAIAATTDAPLQAALQDRGVEIDTPSWRDAGVDWSAYDLAVVRTTWDYVPHRDVFVGWSSRTEQLTAVANPADVLRWNTHKSYLVELEDHGAPIVPTAWLGAGDQVRLDALLDHRGWDRAVVKPAVAAGSDGLLRVSAADAGINDDAIGEDAQRHLDRLLSDGDVMIQPYMGSVETRGELSVIVIDGEVSHAVRKLPAAGDFRIQEEFGGRYREEPIDTQVADLARWIVAATDADLLYARVDLLEAEDGTLQLVELEATEPDLYLSVVPAAADDLAEAIIERARRSVA